MLVVSLPAFPARAVYRPALTARPPPTADTNLGVVMLALLVMGLINYSMRDPCTC